MLGLGLIANAAAPALAVGAESHIATGEERYIFDEYRRDLLRRERAAEQGVGGAEATSRNITLPKSAPPAR